MKEFELEVKGIKCEGCENRIKNVVSEIKGVKEVTASHETGKVKITLTKDINEEIKNNIIAALEKMEFEVKK